DPDRVDLEGGRVEAADLRRNAIDLGQGAVEVLEVGDHDLVPHVQLLQVLYQVFVGHRELAGEVGLHVQVLVGRLDRGRHPDDVGDGRGRGDRHAVGVAHAVATDAFAQRLPVHAGGHVDLHVAAALFGEQFQRILRQDALRPKRAVEGRVAAALLGQLGG